MWVLLVRHASEPAGLIVPLVTAMAVLFGLRRVHRALWVSHRYRFTTWRWGRVLASMMLIGVVLKLSPAA